MLPFSTSLEIYNHASIGVDIKGIHLMNTSVTSEHQKGYVDFSWVHFRKVETKNAAYKNKII